MSDPSLDPEDRMAIHALPLFDTADAAPEESGADRFSARTPRAIDDIQEAESTNPAPQKRWGQKPSVAGQAVRMPDTVRIGTRYTLVLCLSKPADLVKFNEIQARASQQNPTAAIFDDKKDFYDGAYHCCMTYADIEYEQLI